MKPQSNWILLLVVALNISSCNKEAQITRGCKNEFSLNYESDYDENCCCDYDLDAIIEDIAGVYEFKDYCQHFNYEYTTRISRDKDAKDQIIIDDFSIYKQKFMGRFSDGEFLIDEEFYVGGCKFAFKGSLRKEEGKLLLESTNEVIEGICNNLTDLICTAIAD